MLHLVFVLFSLVGDASPADIVYAVESFVRTGSILEDSILWDCATMGNGRCG